ncbi:ATP-binding protein [Limibacter armeniacum]|uniref:ATP-binding protein n=1 Tax=Limibacter armeniacum TaxID=466084 RepID=UPI002FE58EDA
MSTGQKTGREPDFGSQPLYDKNYRIDWGTIEEQPWVKPMMECMQDPVWHAEGDVWIHTQMVCEALLKLEDFRKLGSKKQHLLVLAALLHDIAKPQTTRVEAGRVVAPKHALIGEHKARVLLWNLPLEERETVCGLVRLHGFPVWAIDRQDVYRQIRRHALRLDLHLLYLLAKADVLGRIGDNTDHMLESVELFKELCLEVDCYGKAPDFHNDHSRFKFFRQDAEYPSAIYDDTVFEVTLMCGVAGSGKDTYVKQLDLPSVSLDDIRERLKIPHEDRKGQGRVIQHAMEEAKVLARKKQSFIWNATNLTRDLRNKVISMLEVYGARFRIVYIESSLDNILERRRDEIPTANLLKMAERLEMPTLDEAHQVVYNRN